jgi:hypothetical protein
MAGRGPEWPEVEAGGDGNAEGGGLPEGGLGAQQDEGVQDDGSELANDDLPDGFRREEREENGKKRTFIVCPLKDGESESKRKKFEHYKDVRKVQMRTKRFMELQPRHFARKANKPAMPRLQGDTGDMETGPVAARTSLEKRREYLDRFAAQVDRSLTAGEQVNQTELLERAAVELMIFRDRMSDQPPAGQELMEIFTEIHSTKTEPGNPLNIWPPDSTNNIWADVSVYSARHHPKLTKLCILLHTDLGKPITTKQVIEVAATISSLSYRSSGDRSYLSSIVKSNTVMARTCGLTYSGCDYFSRSSGVTFGHFGAVNLRTEMAALSSSLFKRYAMRYSMMGEVDNLNIRNAGGSFNFTQWCINFQEDRFLDTTAEERVDLSQVAVRMLQVRKDRHLDHNLHHHHLVVLLQLLLLHILLLLRPQPG